jgi:hypothetical protein
LTYLSNQKFKWLGILKPRVPDRKDPRSKLFSRSGVEIDDDAMMY